jgi:hypothetical protein
MGEGGGAKGIAAFRYKTLLGLKMLVLRSAPRTLRSTAVPP